MGAMFQAPLPLALSSLLIRAEVSVLWTRNQHDRYALNPITLKVGEIGSLQAQHIGCSALPSLALELKWKIAQLLLSDGFRTDFQALRSEGALTSCT